MNASTLVRAAARRAFGLGTMCVALLAAVASRDLAAQGLTYDRTALVHGIGSDPRIWVTQAQALGQLTPAEYLNNRVWLKETTRPFLDSGAIDPKKGNSAEQQRAVLVSHLAANPGRFVLIGHSLGGIAARNAFRTDGVGAARIAAIATLASPHRGAPIADRGVLMAAYIRHLERAVESARLNIRNLGLDLKNTIILYVVGEYLVEQSRDPVNFPFGDFNALLQLAALRDLSDTSQNIRDLVAERRDGAVPRGVVVGSIPYQHAIFRLASELGDRSFDDLLGTYHDGLKKLRKCRNLAFLLPASPVDRSCRRAITMLVALDDAWAATTNGVDQAGRRRIIPGDGVVPHERSLYPSSFGELYTETAEGTNHVNIYRTARGLDRSTEVLLSMGLSRTLAPLAAGIEGPSSIQTAGVYTWSTAPSGGDGSYTYEWFYRADGSANADVIARTPSVSLGIAAGQPSFTLQLRVRSQGQPKIVGLHVVNSIREDGWCGYPVCFDQ